MEFGMKISVFVLFIFAFFIEKSGVNAQKCNFPAIFNFGDSNSDTGEAYSLMNAGRWPNGFSVGKENKRGCDGRLIIDFLAESLGIPYLNASLDTNGTSFRYGVNFAVAGQRINPFPEPLGGHNWDYPFFQQLAWFYHFKQRALNASKGAESTNIYPKPEAFTEGLYTIDIGQNDLSAHFGGFNSTQILDFYAIYVKRLLDYGAKYVWIHNTGPLGCLPKMVNWCVPPGCVRDKNGCNDVYNQWSQEFNAELKKTVDEIRKWYPDTVITLVDIYSAKLGLITNNNEFDKELKFKYCCGSNDAFCGYYGKTKNNETVFGDMHCKDPSKYISWDSVHYTEAANKAVAKLILDGAFSEPRVAFSQACRRK